MEKAKINRMQIQFIYIYPHNWCEFTIHLVAAENCNLQIHSNPSTYSYIVLQKYTNMCMEAVKICIGYCNTFRQYHHHHTTIYIP